MAQHGPFPPSPPDPAAAGATAPPLLLPLTDEAATAALAARLAPLLRPGDLIALSGDLGAGKTAFARAVIQSLTHPDEEVPSPTFTLVQTYDRDTAPDNVGAAAAPTVWHFDLYRLSGAEEVLELGWDDARHGIILVEWPDRLGPLLPADRLDLDLAFAADPAIPVATRMARLTGHGDWARRLTALVPA